MTRPAEQPVLTDGTITLRPWLPDDVEAVYEACQDSDIQLWTQVPQPYQRSDAAGFVAERAPAAWRDGTGVLFAVVDASDVLLASVCLVGLDRAARTGEVGYWVAPQARRRGPASGLTVTVSTCSAASRFACSGTSATSPPPRSRRAPSAGPCGSGSELPGAARYDPACPSPIRTVAPTARLPPS